MSDVFADVAIYLDAIIAVIDVVLIIFLKCAGGKPPVVVVKRWQRMEDLETGVAARVAEGDNAPLLSPVGLRSSPSEAAENENAVAKKLKTALMAVRTKKAALTKWRNEAPDEPTPLRRALNFLFLQVPAALIGPFLYYADTSSDVELMVDLYALGDERTDLWANLTASFLALQFLLAWGGVLFYFRGIAPWHSRGTRHARWDADK